MVADGSRYWFENDGRQDLDASDGNGSSEERAIEKEDLFAADDFFRKTEVASAAAHDAKSENTDFKNMGPGEENGVGGDEKTVKNEADDAGAFRDGSQNGAPRYAGSGVPFSEVSEVGGKGEDRHENHYRSDFAKRGGIPDGDLNKNGRIKAVRGCMLKKLLKYDFRALFKILLPCYIVMAALAVVAGISFAILSGSYSEAAERISMSVLSLYILSVAACACVCWFNVPVRFYKNLFSGEGYLTFSIPATPEEQILSKIISGAATVVLTFVVEGLSVLIVLLSGYIITFSDIGYFFSQLGQLIAAEPVDAILFIIEVLLLIPIGLLVSLQVLQCCICLGQMFTKKNRILMAIAVYVIFSAIVEVLAVYFSGAFVGLIRFFGSIGPHGTLWFFIVFLATVNVGAFFIQRYVLKNKLNLA